MLRVLRTSRRSLAKRCFATSAPPHGGELKNLMIDDDAEKESLASKANHTVELNDRQSCDVELLINGGFSPLTGPMNQETYEAVVDNMFITTSDSELKNPSDSTLKAASRGQNIIKLLTPKQ